MRDVRSRDIKCSGFSVRLVYNPGRSINTLAAVTPEEIRERPCFLCAGNLPAGQKGIMYRDDFLILANPRPILPFHLTIAHGTHRDQSIYDSMDRLFMHYIRTLGLISRHSITGPAAGRQPRTICIFKQCRRGRCRSKKNSVKGINFLFCKRNRPYTTIFRPGTRKGNNLD